MSEVSNAFVGASLLCRKKGKEFSIEKKGSIVVKIIYRLSYNWFGSGNEVKKASPIQLEKVYIYLSNL